MNLSLDLKVIRVGLLITLFTLIFGTELGIAFGVKRRSFKSYISENIQQIQQFMMKKVKIKFGDMFKEHTFTQVELQHIH